MASTVYEKIKAAHKLPSPTGVALKILELSQNEASSVDEIAIAVESDPAISSRLLKLVNTPLAGMPRQIVSAHRAIALLGARTVTNLALGFSLVSDHREGRCVSFDYEMFWSESLGRAVAARHIAGRRRNFSPDEAFTFGLLSQLGRLALATAFPDVYGDALKTTVIEKPEDLTEVERAVFGIDHNELAAEMIRDWHMPEIFCDAVRLQGDPYADDLDPSSRVVQFARYLHLAGSIASILTQPTVYRDTLSALVVEANGEGITPYAYHDMFDAIGQDWRETGTVLSVKTRRVPPLAEMYSRARERRVSLEAAGARPATEDTGGSRYARD